MSHNIKTSPLRPGLSNIPSNTSHVKPRNDWERLLASHEILEQPMSDVDLDTLLLSVGNDHDMLPQLRQIYDDSCNEHASLVMSSNEGLHFMGVCVLLSA
jgi:hypothetical protein